MQVSFICMITSLTQCQAGDHTGGAVDMCCGLYVADGCVDPWPTCLLLLEGVDPLKI